MTTFSTKQGNWILTHQCWIPPFCFAQGWCDHVALRRTKNTKRELLLYLTSSYKKCWQRTHNTTFFDCSAFMAQVPGWGFFRPKYQLHVRTLELFWPKIRFLHAVVFLHAFEVKGPLLHCWIRRKKMLIYYGMFFFFWWERPQVSLFT